MRLAGDGGLVGGFAGLEEGLPLDGLAEDFGHPGHLGGLGRPAVENPGRERRGPPGRRAHAHQGADVTVFEDPLGPQSDLDLLFAVGGHGRAVCAANGGEESMCG